MKKRNLLQNYIRGGGDGTSDYGGPGDDYEGWNDELKRIKETYETLLANLQTVDDAISGRKKATLSSDQKRMLRMTYEDVKKILLNESGHDARREESEDAIDLMHEDDAIRARRTRHARHEEEAKHAEETSREEEERRNEEARLRTRRRDAASHAVRVLRRETRRQLKELEESSDGSRSRH